MQRYFVGESVIELPKNFTVVEIQTTDLNPIKDQITEIATEKYRSNKLIDEYSSEVDNDNICQVLDKLNRFIGQDDILINRSAFFCPFIGNAYVKYLNKPLANNVVDIQRLFKVIEKHDTAKLDQMIKFYSLNTPHVYQAKKDIKSVVEIYFKLQDSFAKHFNSIKEIQPKSSEFTLKDIPGDPNKNDQSNVFYGKNVSVTGELHAYTRKEIGQVINNIGGHFQMNPGKKTDYFIVGKLNKKSNRLKKAKSLPDIQFLSENEFLSMIAGYEWC